MANKTTSDHAAKKQKDQKRITWATFQNNALQEIREPADEQQNEDGSTTLTKTFVVVTQDLIGSGKIEEEFDDVREAYQCFAKAAFLRFIYMAERSFDAYDTLGEPCGWEFPTFLKPALKIKNALLG